MVTKISLARKRGDGLSPGSLLDFISHSTGRLCVRNTLTLKERGSLSLGVRALFTWSWAVPSTFIHFNILIVFVYLLSTPIGGLRLISDFYPSRLVYRGIEALNLT